MLPNKCSVINPDLKFTRLCPIVIHTDSASGVQNKLCMLGLYKDYLLIVLLVEDKPKDVIKDLRRKTAAHWNLILPKIRLYKVVIYKV